VIEIPIPDVSGLWSTVYGSAEIETTDETDPKTEDRRPKTTT
jgi:hypothetical protein